jgi:signal transduction histidine kinase
VQLAVYRIVQEALTNCLKHSSGHHAAVRIDRGAEAVEIEVVDDGRPLSAALPGNGHGITGMRERVAFYGGTLEAAARDGGFAVHAVLPVAQGTEPQVAEAAT